ncbi:hypothetical protein BR93DRAFT_970584 [Coniochaeta sp. PMI_546]|nr:hypothetical protein BR93DRAFT_970584 [Coniochaeta sp. PMI_546]
MSSGPATVSGNKRSTQRTDTINVAASEPAARRRARQSCDACKSRKTKCVQTGTGPCRYCASTGGICSTSVRLQRRPYYRVSEEEYQCCMRLLRHFVPNATLDMKTMKAMIAEIEAGSDLAVSTPPKETEESEESEVLQEELGCMIIDARGSYRYVGADSSVRFANAVAQGQTRNHDPAIMVPLVRSRLPPATPESIHGGSDRPTPTDHHPFPDPDKKPYLPARDVCQRYAMRFFDEIQSIYWFYSPEQFYTLLDKTYADGGTATSASWLCSLYCIFAICSAREEEEGGEVGGCPPGRDRKSSEYLAMAKSLGTAVCDEADADAVRALALTSLALHSGCYTVTAYLVIGMTVRMAYSLGLHRDITPRGQDSVTRARAHRLWWTVYLLDQEVAVQLGYPCAIVDEAVGVRTPLACESVLDPGRPTPHGYQAACVGLVRLKKRISHALYVAPALSTRKVPFSAVTGCIGGLRDWLAGLPPHLCWSAGMAPGHRRAVAVLHLRYWTTLIHVQRPFLLYAVTRGGELEGNKKRWYEELSGLCLDAAEKGVVIIRRMREHGLLSSLVLFDSQCIQELVQVLLLGKEWTGPRAAVAAEGLETCMDAMKGMECVGWCEKILPELTATVAARTQAMGGRAGGEGVERQQDGKRVEESSLEDRAPSGMGSPWSAAAGTVQPMDDGLMDAFFDNFQDFQYNIDAQLDVFDTLDLDMGTFAVQEGMYF